MCVSHGQSIFTTPRTFAAISIRLPALCSTSVINIHGSCQRPATCVFSLFDLLFSADVRHFHKYWHWKLGWVAVSLETLKLPFSSFINHIPRTHPSQHSDCTLHSLCLHAVKRTCEIVFFVLFLAEFDIRNTCRRLMQLVHQTDRSALFSATTFTDFYWHWTKCSACKWWHFHLLPAKRR